MGANKIKDRQGYTLVELMVVLVLTMLASMAIYRGYVSFSRTADVQAEIGEMHQNLRIAASQLTKSLRMAGYDPTGTAEAGFVTAEAGLVTYTRDSDDDGTIDSPTVSPAPPETISYRLNGTDLERDLDNGGGWQAVVENIRALDLRYFDGDGDELTRPVTSASDRENIRVVQISLVAETANNDSEYIDTASYDNAQGNVLVAQNDNRHRRLITVRVQSRNMGLD